MGGALLIVIAMGIAILLKAANTFETLVYLGLWIILAFFLLVFMHQSIRGVPRTRVRIPPRLTLLTFTCSGLLFLAAWRLQLG